VQKQLKQANIDIYVIDITSLIIEMENKISRIDFVNANVDELLHEWSNQSQDQAPIYVRQMMWLAENAKKYGYQQSGNGWELKG